jgi:hypothetical protein
VLDRKDLAFERFGEVTPPDPSAELVTVSIGAVDYPVALWSEPGGLVASRGAGGSALSLDGIDPYFPRIQSFVDGSVLVANSRVRTGESVTSWLFGTDGELLNSGCLGDVIEHLIATPDDEVWVGYFDEGACGSSEPECNGLVRFDSTLHVTWRHDQGGPNGTITDCYALNVGGRGGATFYAYTDFAIVRPIPAPGRRWLGAPPAAHALAISGSTIVLAGGYRPDGKVVHWLKAGGGGQVDCVARGEVVGLPASVRVHGAICRDSTLDVFDSTDWYRADIEK